MGRKSNTQRQIEALEAEAEHWRSIAIELGANPLSWWMQNLSKERD